MLYKPSIAAILMLRESNSLRMLSVSIVSGHRMYLGRSSRPNPRLKTMELMPSSTTASSTSGSGFRTMLPSNIPKGSRLAPVSESLVSL